VVYGARERREAMRQLADLRRRLADAEAALEEAHAARKHAEETFDAASDRFDAAEAALDAARDERARARTGRYAARQAYERASTTVDRLRRRVRELAERLDRAAELAARLPLHRIRVLIVVYEHASARMVVVSEAVRARASVGARQGDRVVRAVRLRASPRGVPGPGQLRAPDSRLPGARVPVGVVQPAAPAGRFRPAATPIQTSSVTAATTLQPVKQTAKTTRLTRRLRLGILDRKMTLTTINSTARHITVAAESPTHIPRPPIRSCRAIAIAPAMIEPSPPTNVMARSRHSAADNAQGGPAVSVR
jgi:hypothetical protein